MVAIAADDLPLPPRRFSLASAIRRNPTITFGGVLLLLLIAVAIIGPSFVGDPLKIAPTGMTPRSRWRAIAASPAEAIHPQFSQSGAPPN